jgi:hypothetical protein
MNLNLDTLKGEIRDYLEGEGFVVFHGYSRLAELDSFVAWDTDRLPDYRTFLNTAKAAGVRMIVYHFREFSSVHIDDATDRLEDAEFGADERRNVERRLRELHAYEGFTCAIELSFDYQGRVYVFNLRSDWYEEYFDLLEEIDAAIPETAEEDEDDSMGGYYSRN